MKVKQLAEVWNAASSEKEKEEAIKFIIKTLINDVERSIADVQASTYADVIGILELVQTKWHKICQRTDGLSWDLFKYAIRKYDEDMYAKWMDQKVKKMVEVPQSRKNGTPQQRSDAAGSDGQ